MQLPMLGPATSHLAINPSLKGPGSLSPHRKKAGPSDRSRQSFGLLPHLGRYFFEVLGIGWGCFPSNHEKAGTVLHNPHPIQKTLLKLNGPWRKKWKVDKKKTCLMKSLRINIWKSVNKMARKGHQTPLPLTIWSLCLCPQRHEWSSGNKVWYPRIPALFSSTLGNPTERWERSASSGASMAFLKVSYLPRWRSLRWPLPETPTIPQKKNETKIGIWWCNLPFHFFPESKKLNF